ncbi:MAG: IS200/IS605 family transposase [Acidobacteria bacterium]|nr:MAG: IS200/IS605 family transposase [Acidobacteriota bacterium]REJ99164.1 MAG: IS200/IS605 family transposase [Acidobacteriota bacterium]REK16115.1 MAG: IS200/IS605 family transposase [Acidobacteriota bacterium]REK43796.1 MAG: IS200/IS605 family transposase [Acidobacteriota bacterium]
MPNTYSQIYIHIVFAVKGRKNLIDRNWREELYKYITGTVQNKRNKMIAIGGIEDHVHMLIGLNPSQVISDLVRDVKVSSTLFVNKKRFVMLGFQWQEGYGAFTISREDIPVVAHYIENQERHHKRQSFEDEYKDILDENGIKFEERFLFEWL